MNLSWANQLAKTALKSAQQKIDSVLDIRTEGDETDEAAVVDDLLLTPVAQPDLQNDEPTTSNTVAPPFVHTDTGQDETAWGSAWGGPAGDPEIVVDSEPNPIRDDDRHVSGTLLDHSPSSNSSDAHDGEPHQSPSKDNTYSDIDITEQISALSDRSSPQMITEEPVLPPHLGLSRRSSRHDDSLTVASSDIEVIRNVDAWSVASSKLANDVVSLPNFTVPKTEELTSLHAQMKAIEQSRNELKSLSDAQQKSNSQLQQRIVILNQQNNAMKKELDDKKTELEELLQEGKKISDYSGKQAREIRRLKNELSELEKIKSERKRFRDEKTQAEELVQLQQEEINSLKDMVKSLESTSKQLKKEQNLTVASSEVVQKHMDEQGKRVSDLQSELAESHTKNAELEELLMDLKSEMEQVQSVQWAEKLAGERASESAASAGFELSEAREQIQRLTKHLKNTEKQLESVMLEHSNIAETIAKANAPLLEELSDMKMQLTEEQRLAEESDQRCRTAQREANEMRIMKRSIEEKFTADLSSQRAEMEGLITKNATISREVERLQTDHKNEINELKVSRNSLKDKVAELQTRVLEVQDEGTAVRKNLKEFKEENDQLKQELVEIKKAKERSATPVMALSQPSPAHKAHSSNNDEALEVQIPMTPAAFTFGSATTSGTAAQVELESMSIQYNSSMKRLGVLEREAARCIALEKQVKQLQQELKDLHEQNNQLLEVDGERMEKIEELTHDIIDLRKLMKDQLLAFADAKVREGN